MGRQVQKGWRGGVLAYLAQPSQIFSVFALAGLLLDVGTGAVAGIEWGLGHPPGRPAPALLALAVSAALCPVAVFVPASKPKRGIAIAGVAMAVAAFWLFWPSIGLPG
jgi:hypothetical protein